MAKHFKSKKKLRHSIIVKYIFLTILCYMIIKLCLFLTLKIPIFKFTFDTNKLGEYKKYIINSTLNNPKYLLPYFKEKNIETVYVNKNNKKPLIYIYNTHQEESYINNKTVWDAAYFMKDEFSKNQVETIVEQGNIAEFMQTNNISYSYSYFASKFFVQSALRENDLDLLIDLHRDATEKDISTIQINGKNYAKILFVVGGENKNYKQNYDLANTISDLVNQKYKNLSRGVIVKTEEKGNGVYNQDLSNKIILLELGCNNSSFDEVENTIKLIVPIIGEYLYESR